MEGSSIEAASNDVGNPYIQLETSLREKLDRLSPMSPSRCIFRVPHRLRCQLEKAYTPQVISIGPLHHGKQASKAMEEHKISYLQCFMGRTNVCLMDYIEKIKVQEARLRNCYSETIELESDEFVRIILVDAIFLIEFLFRYWCPEVIDENDCIFCEPQMITDVWPDLLMLENQLPFFILVDLFDPHIFPIPSKYSDKLKGVECLSILFLSCHFLNDKQPLGGKLDNLETIKSSKIVKIQHFVDLLRKFCIAPILKEQSAERSKLTTAPSIAKLHLAGVKIKVRSTENLFDIRFKDGILEIPKLKIMDVTELILRNLIALEQCSFEEKYISNYVAIMDMLVDTPKDVELLVKYKIVENVLGGGDTELSTMINNISTEVAVSFENFSYGTICEDLNKFCSLKWHNRMANLKQNYFNTPWATISFVAAVLLLIFTMVQTICSIISLP